MWVGIYKIPGQAVYLYRYLNSYQEIYYKMPLYYHGVIIKTGKIACVKN